jgi:hypothetical protein
MIRAKGVNGWDHGVNAIIAFKKGFCPVNARVTGRR